METFNEFRIRHGFKRIKHRFTRITINSVKYTLYPFIDKITIKHKSEVNDYGIPF